MKIIKPTDDVESTKVPETQNIQKVSEQPKQVMLTFTEEQLNTLINKATSNAVDTIIQSGVLNKSNTVLPLKQITLKDFVKLNKTAVPVELGRLVVTAFMNSDMDSLLYQEIYDFFFKYRIGETLIRYTMDLSKTCNSIYEDENYNDTLRTCVSLTDMTFERIGTIVLEQFKIDSLVTTDIKEDYDYE